MRVAFTLMGGKNWTGGYNYLLNLVRVLGEHQAGRVTPVLFFGTDAPADEAAPFAGLPGAEIVRSPVMNASRKGESLRAALLWGADGPTRALFRAHRVHVVFESAQFFGWRVGLPVIGWIPDFQHRLLPHMFSRAGYWKRDVGFQVQVASGREIMLSSDDSRLACEQYYPSTRERTHTVRFAVPAAAAVPAAQARAVADGHGLSMRYFFMPNQFHKHKNHLLVLDALALLRARGQHVVVAASGRQMDLRHPDHFPHLLQRIDALGLTDAFRLLGMVPYADLAPLMQASVALLNPSLFEGWSTTVEEAKSAGVPMLLSDLPVHREQAGTEAHYFERHSAASLADALQAFPELTPAERERRARDAREEASRRVRRFAEEFVSLVRHCVQRSATA